MTRLVGAFRSYAKAPKKTENPLITSQKKKKPTSGPESEWNKKKKLGTATVPLRSGLPCRFEQGCANVPKT